MSAHPLSGRRVLVTGAAGCIGAWTVKLLSELGAQPVIFDLSKDRTRHRLIGAGEAKWVHGDICDFAALIKVIKSEDIYAIIHLAALQVPLAKADPLLGTRVNVIGTANILEAARQAGITRTVFASSIAAPAMGDNPYLDTLYGAHKVCNEQMAKVYWQDWQVPSVCIRPGVIYGPGRDQGMSAAPTIAMLATLVGRGYDIPFTGSVSFVHAKDAAARFIGAVSRETSGALVFDMDGMKCTMNSVLEIIRARASSGKITISGAPLPFPANSDDGRLDAYIGAPPHLSFVDGMAQTLFVFETARRRGDLPDEYIDRLFGAAA